MGGPGVDGRGPAEEIRAQGMPLGLLPGIQYEEKEFTLAPGQGVLFYSDGLVEAHSAGCGMFGSTRLQSLLGHPSLARGASLIDHLLHNLSTHAGHGVELEDEVTLVSLERLEAGAGP